MTRWIIVLVVLCSTAVALYTVRWYAPEAPRGEEILAHEVSEGQPVTFLIPGETERLFVSSWAIVEPQGPYAPEKRYDYGVQLVLRNQAGAVVSERFLNLQSRISFDPSRATSSGLYAAKLLNGDAWVADGRTRVIETSELLGDAGSIQFEASGDSRLLLRVGRPETRSDLEREVLQRALPAERLERYVQGRAAVRFQDLPAEARTRALGTWGRRLTARGKEQADYVTRRLLIGEELPPADQPLDARPDIVVGRDRAAALNFNGPLELYVHADRGTRLMVREGDRDAYSALVGDSEQVALDLAQQGARTVAISSAADAALRFSVSRQHFRRQLGSVDQVVRGQRVYLQPDFRILYYLELSPDSPVISSIGPGQPLVGLSVRALSRRTRSPTTSTLHILWQREGAAPTTATLTVSPTHSSFDTVDGQPATDPVVALLQPPPGATRLSITGPHELTVALWTREPGVKERSLLPSYDVVLPDDHVWRNAPYAQSPVASIRADNFEQLRLAQRLHRVQTQVRIEPLEAGQGRPLAERVLKPSGAPVSRRMFRPAYHGKYGRFPTSGWTPIGDASTAVRIASEGRHARQTHVLYRGDPDRLGARMTLRVDGKSVEERRLTFLSGTLNARVSPGAHRVSLEGLGAAGLAFVAAPPAEGGAIVKQQSFYQVKAGGLRLEFERKRGELASLFVFIASEARAVPFRIRYEIDPNRQHPPDGRFLRRLTEFSGLLSGKTGSLERGLFWERDAALKWSGEMVDRISRAHIPLGDDLSAGRHEIVFSLDPEHAGDTVWLRGVLAGRVLDDEARKAQP